MSEMINHFSGWIGNGRSSEDTGKHSLNVLDRRTPQCDIHRDSVKVSDAGRVQPVSVPDLQVKFLYVRFRVSSLRL